MNFRYQLSFKNQCHRACDYCDDFGAKSDQNMTRLDLPRVKEKLSSYSEILVSCNASSSKDEQALLNEAINEKQKFIYQIHIDDYLTTDRDTSKIYEVISDDFFSLLKLESMELNDVSNILLIVKKKNHKFILKNWFKILNKVRSKIKFRFIQNDKSKVGFLKCHSIYNFRKRLCLKDPTLRDDQFVSDVDLFEPRVANDMDLEATYKPIFTNEIANSKILLSIVIPSYNNKNEVMQTIKYLNNQSLAKESYEIILVDDGSTDFTSQFIQSNFKKLGLTANFKLIHYPRVVPRKPGDKRFRAGLARNVGVKQAIGEKLMFCDADIVFPKVSLETILDELKLTPVIQIQRHYLKQGVKVSQLNKPSFNIKEHSFHPNNGYWRDFYADGANWMNYKAPWKYICTFGLALSRQDFIEAGRFRKVFLNYGFEDTDLGYRLFKKGLQFKLSEVKAYHQFGKYERNEYAHSSFKRHNLLSTTAKIFYRHYADPDIYEELPSFLRV